MGFADAPVWLAGLIMAIAFPLAMEAGYRLHAVLARGPADGEASSGAGHIVSAALALLGLLIGFTFAMAAERYETRRALVVGEANAIGTTYLRDQLLAEPERGRLLVLLGDYAKVRQSFAAAGVDARRLDDVDARTAEVQARIWAETGAALRAPAAAPFTTSVLQTTNDMFDFAATQRAALDARVPDGVFSMLALFAALAAAIMGYGLAAGRRRHLVASSGLFVMVAMAIALVIDLDQPHAGGIRVSQTPLNRMAASIARDLARAFPGSIEPGNAHKAL